MKVKTENIILLAALIGLSATLYMLLTETFTPEIPEIKAPLILNETFEVERNDIYFFEVNLTEGEEVNGYFTVKERVCINFYLLDEENFPRMLADENFTALKSAIHATHYNFTFTPKKSGKYYFVFDNKRLVEDEVCEKKIITFKLYRTKK